MRCRKCGAFIPGKLLSCEACLEREARAPEDPHHIRSKEEAKLRAKARRAVDKARDQCLLWDPL